MTYKRILIVLALSQGIFNKSKTILRSPLCICKPLTLKLIFNLFLHEKNSTIFSIWQNSALNKDRMPLKTQTIPKHSKYQHNQFLLNKIFHKFKTQSVKSRGISVLFVKKKQKKNTTWVEFKRNRIDRIWTQKFHIRTISRIFKT